MTLDKSRQAYYDLSAKASEVARQLSFAGIALIWIFKLEGQGPIAVPKQLYYPASLFVIALALDLMQYVFGALIWGIFSRYHERKGTKADKPLTAPVYFNWPALLCFWSKLLLVVVAYLFVLDYIRSLLLAP